MNGMTEAELKEFYLNKQKIKQLEERNNDLIANAGLRSAPIGVYTEGPYVVEVSRNARFNGKLATELFPLGPNGENMHLYKAEVDSALAKKHLSKEDYERCQTVFDNNKVEVKLT